MSKQTHRDRVTDASKKRREYLRRKITARISIAIGACFALVFGYASLASLFAPHEPHYSYENQYAYMVLGTSITFAVCGGWLLRDSVKESKSLQYVPPVSEQLAALPAEEILVRGSEQPAATPDELLRAAQAGTETQAGELLRARHTE